MTSKYELIMIICNHGYSEEIMESAKLAGARGGTIMHGRSTATHEEKKFFGITIHPEKDILLIVTTDIKKSDIMKSVVTNHGVETDAHSLCFSVPVDEVFGFNF